MKRLLLTTEIFARQAFPRAKAFNMLNKNAEIFALHVAKCVVYGNQFNCLDHWLDELKNWISFASVVKPKSGKLSLKDYKDTLFGYLGDDKNDALCALKNLQLVAKSGKYPDFEITKQMIDSMFNFSDKIIHVIGQMLVQAKGNEISDIVIQQTLNQLYKDTVI